MSFSCFSALLRISDVQDAMKVSTPYSVSNAKGRRFPQFFLVRCPGLLSTSCRRIRAPDDKGRKIALRNACGRSYDRLEGADDDFLS